MDLTGLWIALGIIGAVIAVIAIWWVVMYNRFIRLRNDIEESASTIQVYEKKRYDLVPNLVSTVKGYAKHETDIFDGVTAARADVLRAKSPQQREQSEAQLTRTLGRLLAVAEAYPDLKANTTFLELQGQLGHIEEQIASARKYYNANVKLFNTQLETWPSRIIARRQGYTKQPLFAVENAAEQRNVKVEF